MKIIAFAALTLVVLGSLGAQEATQKTRNRSRSQGKDMYGRDAFATRWQLSKGGIGMVNKHLYVVVKSGSDGKNGLIVAPTETTEERWYGKSVAEPEVAIFYAGKVWSSQSLPGGFDLSKAVVVSFERDKVRYFDFQAFSGGYYDRIAE
jgi:hypothetical protein